MSNEEVPTHFSSTGPHRALMAICTLFVLGVCAALAAGWYTFFRLREVRAVNEAISEKLERQRHPETTTPLQPMRDAAEPVVSLTDLGRPELQTPAATEITEVSQDVPTAERDAALAVLTAFQTAVTREDKLAWVHRAEEMGTLMANFYDTQGQGDPRLSELRSVLGFRLMGMRLLNLAYAGSRANGTVEVALLQDDKTGEWKLDWPSLVGYSEVSWESFKEQRISEPKLFRVFAKRAEYWNFEFSDESEYLSVQLLSPDGLQSLHGYCERSTAVGEKLGVVLGNSAMHSALALRLAFPENAESDHCVSITEVVGERWLLPTLAE